MPAVGSVAIVTGGAQSATSIGLNLSLFKMSTIIQAAIGIFVTASVLTSTAAGVGLFTAISVPQRPTTKLTQVTVFKGVPKSIDVLRNCYDSRGGNLTIIKVYDFDHGTASYENGKEILYTSKKPLTGTYYFKYQITNGKLNADGEVEVTILNNIPETIDIEYTIKKNSINNIFDIFSYKSKGLGIVDLDGDELQIYNITGVEHGEISFNTSHFFYTPEKESKKTEHLTYTIWDGTAYAKGNITIYVLNQAPNAKRDKYDIPKYQVATLDVLENDYDANYDDITVTYVRSYTKGSVSHSEDRKLLYYFPSKNDRKTFVDSFEYGITDGELNAQSICVVNVYNQKPYCKDSNIIVSKNSNPTRIFLNIEDPDEMDVVTAKKITTTSDFSELEQVITTKMGKFQGFYEEVQYNNYSVFFTPNKDSLYSTQFHYQVTDGEDSTDCYFDVEVINDAPIALPLYVSKSRNIETSISVSSVISDPNNDKLILFYETETWETHLGGTVRIDVNDPNKQTLIYTPKKDSEGTDYFIYKITDVQDDVNKQLNASSYVYVTLLNDPPTAVDVSFTIPKGTTQNLDVLKNANDINGDDIIIGEFNSNSNSGVELTSDIDKKKIIYKAQDIVGNDFFYFKAKDYADTAVESTKVSISIINVPPTAENVDGGEIDWNDGQNIAHVFEVLQNAFDENPDDIPQLIVDPTSLRMIEGDYYELSTIENNKKIKFVPIHGFSGSIQIGFKVKDPSNELSNEAILNILVINEPPVCNDISKSGVHSKKITIDVLSECTSKYPDFISEFKDFSHGVVNKVLIGGKYHLEYQPTNGYVGSDSITYTVSNGILTDTKTINIQLTNNAPIINPKEISIHWKETSKRINVLTDSIDNDNDILTLQNVVVPNVEGTIQYFTNGTVIFFPNHLAIGSFAGTYSVNDGATTVQSTFSIQISNNAIPQSKTITKEIHWREALTGIEIEILSDLFDQDLDSVSYSIKSLPENGNVVETSDKIVTFSTSVLGEDEFVCEITDGLAKAEVNVIIKTENNAPNCSTPLLERTMHWTEVQNPQGITLTLVTANNDLDPEDQSYLTITNIQDTDGHTVNLLGDNKSVQYKWDSGSTGTHTWTYQVSDGKQVSETCSVKIIVNSIEQKNTDQNYRYHWTDVYPTAKNLPILVPLSDPSCVLVSISKQPIEGATLELDLTTTPHSVWYKSKEGFTGQDNFEVQFSDGVITDVITVIIDVWNGIPIIQNKAYTYHWTSFSSEPNKVFDILDDMVLTENDSDTITLICNNDATKGTVTKTVDNKCQYSVSSLFSGTDTFTYQVSDGFPNFITTKTVRVTSNNAVPVVRTKQFNVHWKEYINGKSLNIIDGSDTIEPNENWTNLQILTPTYLPSNPSNPTIQKQSETQITISNTNGWIGTIQIPMTVSDGLQSIASTVTHSINVYNNPPNFEEVSISPSHWKNIVENNLVIDLTSNISDEDPLDIVSLKSVSVNIGSVSYEGKVITYSLTKENVMMAISQGVKIVVVITDGLNDVSKEISVPITNNEPVASQQNINLFWSSTLNNNVQCSDSNGDALTYSIKTAPIYGTFTLNLDGSYSYVYNKDRTDIYTETPAPDGKYKGIERIVVSCTDGVSTPKDSEILITVYNTKPSCSDGSLTFQKLVSSNSEKTLTISGSDSDADTWNIVDLSISDPSGVAYANIQGHSIKFRSVNTYSGIIVLNFKVSDTNLKSDQCSYTITVQNNAPVCTNFPVAIVKDGQFHEIKILNDVPPKCTDSNEDSLIIDRFEYSGPGTIQLNSPYKSIQYKAVVSSSGAEIIRVHVDDGTITTAMDITVNVGNRNPIPQNQQVSLVRSPTMSLQTVNTLQGAVDPDGDTMRLDASSVVDQDNCFGDANQATLTIQGQYLKIQPSTAQYDVTCRINYDIIDDFGGRASATTTYTVSDSDPIARDDVFESDQGSTKIIYFNELLANDQDPNGGAVTFDTFSCPPTYCAHGAPTYVYDQNQNKIGLQINTDPNSCDRQIFKYSIKKDNGKTAEATATVKFLNCVCKIPIDILITLDSSSSISGTEWTIMINFVKSLINRLEISTTAVNVGLIQFERNCYYQSYCGNSQTVYGDQHCGFELTSNKQYALSKVDTLIRGSHTDYQCIPGLGCANWRGGTATFQGLVCSKYFLEQWALRSDPNIPKVVVFITDGAPTVMGGKALETCELIYNHFQQMDPSLREHTSCTTVTEPVIPYAQLVNSWPNWKIVSLGIDMPTSGEAIVRGINYDPNSSYFAEWSGSNGVDSFVSTIIESSCSRT